MAQEPEKYLLLATNHTGTMQYELNEAGARGYRFADAQGGETAFGGREAVVIMTLDPEGRRFRYILLATNRTGTMQREMNEDPPELQLRRHDRVLFDVWRHRGRRHPQSRDCRRLTATQRRAVHPVRAFFRSHTLTHHPTTASRDIVQPSGAQAAPLISARSGAPKSTSLTPRASGKPQAAPPCRP